MLSNNSSIRVGTSLRSGTLQYLQISEYGKLCAQFADKAREVRTGALNTLQAGQVVFIESTAEGKEGHFFEMCETAQAKQRMGTRLTPLDFKFHFYPWWREPTYELDPEGVVIGDDLRKYFDKLESCNGIQLSDRKRAWYSKKMRTAPEQKREYPSTSEEVIRGVDRGRLLRPSRWRRPNCRAVLVRSKHYCKDSRSIRPHKVVWLVPLQHLRQLRTLRTTRIVHVVRNSLKFIRERFSDARISKAPSNVVAPIFAPALTASHSGNPSSVMPVVHCI